MEQLALAWNLPRKQWTVSDLTDRLNGLLSEEFGDFWVAGEISGAKASSAGHWYFNLKDDRAQLRCACFRMAAMRLRVKPADGMAVLARGHLEVYPARGEYQLIVDSLEPQGLGALQLAFEQLKQKLAAEGLFAAERKRPLPKYPRRIGIVTSPTGAAIRDMLTVLSRRAPGSHIRLYPAQVQGEQAVEQVCRALRYFAREEWAEVLIVGRGGGSLEDLWTFNEEAVARALAAMPVPVVSAVGHETDFTIADFVADLRAPTPSAAAELVSAGWATAGESLANCRRHLLRAIRHELVRAREQFTRRGVDRARLLVQLRLNRTAQRLDEWDARLRRTDPRVRVATARTRLTALEASLRAAVNRRVARTGEVERWETRAVAAMQRRLALLRPRLDRAAASCEQLSPLRVLDRGYAILQSDSGEVVKTPPEKGAELQARVAGGNFSVRVE